MNTKQSAVRAQTNTPAARQALEGVVVIDLSHIYNGPYATFLMAMAGATVIKIEPLGGEHLRIRANLGGASLPFAMLNCNKKAITLNLKSERGRSLLLDMVRKADVLVENFAPGVTDRLGIGATVLQEANPRLIYASSSGYGRSGPYRDYPAMDLTVQAMSGVMSITGFQDREPVKAGPAVCDFFAGTHLFGGIMMALYEREKTGKGKTVEVSMQEAVYASLSSNLGMYHGSGGKLPPRTGNRHGGLAESPYNVYPARDGHIAIICNNNRHFFALLKAMGRDELQDDPRFCDLKSRIKHINEVMRWSVSGPQVSSGSSLSSYCLRIVCRTRRCAIWLKLSMTRTCTHAARCNGSTIPNTAASWFSTARFELTAYRWYRCNPAAGWVSRTLMSIKSGSESRSPNTISWLMTT